MFDKKAIVLGDVQYILEEIENNSTKNRIRIPKDLCEILGYTNFLGILEENQ